MTLGIFGVYQNLQENWDSSSTEFSGKHVLRNELPPIEISYLSQTHLPQARVILNNLKTIIDKFQADTGTGTVPRVQVTLNSNLERTEIYPSFNDGVLVTANFSDYNDYEHSMLNTIALHHLLLKLTNNRWDYESRHWLLDGLARWWAEGADLAPGSLNNPEHFARAILALRRFSADDNPLLVWQRATDQYGFEAVEAMAYTALEYLANHKSVETVVQLTVDYINEKPGSSSAESIKRMLYTDNERFERLTGIEFEQFTTDWLDWVHGNQYEPAVSELLDLVPTVNGVVTTDVDDKGVHWIEASYQLRDQSQLQQSYDGNITGTCVLRHQPTSAYDLEIAISARERDRSPCVTDQVAHRIEAPYSAGDRVYVLLEYEHERFARPIPLWAGRVSFQ